MKNLNFILFLVFGIGLYAQPTITKTGVDRINIPITFKAGDVAPTVTAGPSGANVIWDFSAYTAPNIATSTTSECPGQSNCFRFPGANRITKPALSDFYDFMTINDSESVMIGSYGGPGMGDVTVTYTDPLVEFKFPVTYQQQFIDTYQFNSVSTTIGNTSETGQVDNKADAYGTIITPTGTYSNVLRIRKMRTATQTVQGFPDPVAYTNETYLWVSQTAGVVFTFGINSFVFNGVPNVTRSISYLDSPSLSTTDLDRQKTTISVYPNPGSDFITVTSKDDLKKVVITSLEGKVVVVNQNANTIDISALPKGTYILQGELKNGSLITQKIIKK